MKSEKLLTFLEVCDELNLSEGFVRKLVDKRTLIPVAPEDGTLRFDESDVLALKAETRLQRQRASEKCVDFAWAHGLYDEELSTIKIVGKPKTKSKLQ